MISGINSWFPILSIKILAYALVFQNAFIDSIINQAALKTLLKFFIQIIRSLSLKTSKIGWAHGKMEDAESDIAIRFVDENDYREISAKAVSAKWKLKKNRPSSLV